MFLFGAMITYLFELATYIILRVRFPQLNRGFVSPTGIWGALFAALVFGTALVGGVQYSASGAWPPLVGIGVWFALSMSYYLVYARHNVKLSPEEQMCLFMVRRPAPPRPAPPLARARIPMMHAPGYACVCACV